MDLESFDQEYVDKLMAGDAQVVGHFTGYFGDLLWIKLRSRVRSPQLREDALQETFLRVLNYLRKNKLEHPERLGAFVHTVCNNVLMEAFRSESRLVEWPEHLEEPAAPDWDNEKRLVSEERKRAVRKVIEDLPEKDQKILRSVFLEERNKDEICREMNVDREYLRVLVHRAKARFREALRKGKAAALAMWVL